MFLFSVTSISTGFQFFSLPTWAREFLKTAQAEQEFLVGLDGNLKYSSHDNKLQAAITRAHTEQKEGGNR
jgi:hypothetical protein